MCQTRATPFTWSVSEGGYLLLEVTGFIWSDYEGYIGSDWTETWQYTASGNILSMKNTENHNQILTLIRHYGIEELPTAQQNYTEYAVYNEPTPAEFSLINTNRAGMRYLELSEFWIELFHNATNPGVREGFGDNVRTMLRDSTDMFQLTIRTAELNSISNYHPEVVFARQMIDEINALRRGLGL